LKLLFNVLPRINFLTKIYYDNQILNKKTMQLKTDNYLQLSINKIKSISVFNSVVALSLAISLFGGISANINSSAQAVEVEKASIVNSWGLYTDQPIMKGDKIIWTTTVYNEGKIPLTKFNIKNDGFAASQYFDPASFKCTPQTAGTTFTTTELLAGVDFTPIAPIPLDAFYNFDCEIILAQDVVTGEVLVDNAYLASAAGQTLTIVEPSQIAQSDKNVATPADIAMDSVALLKADYQEVVERQASLITKWTNVPKDGYSVGDILEFEVTVGNEGSTPLDSFSLSSDLFAGATNLSQVVCDKDYTNNELSDFIFDNADMIPVGKNYTAKCLVKVNSDSGLDLVHKTTLDLNGEITSPDIMTAGRESNQSDTLTGTLQDDSEDTIRIAPKSKTLVSIVTPRTGGQIAISVTILALVIVSVYLFKKRIVTK
jgi:hypothetical protein